jgi:phage/plasmid primase-like uncharacterized protein
MTNLTTTDSTAALAEHAAEIKRLGKRVVRDIIEIGARLTECKRICGHGQWLPWLDREFGWTEQTARNFMQAHAASLKSPNFGDLDIPISGLYLLAAPSTPDEARDAWIEQAKGFKLESVLRRNREWQKILAGCGRREKLAGPCPKCGGRDRFRVDLGKGNGVFLCRGCNASGGGAISLTMAIDGCGFLKACETLTGTPPPDDSHHENDDERRACERRTDEIRHRRERERRECEAHEAADQQKAIRYCDQLWAQAVALPPEAVAYFAGRGLDVDATPDRGGLRWHPDFPQWIGGPTRPSIIARFTDAITAQRGGIWHRPITGEKPKALGPMRGHVLRLWPDEQVTTGLCIGEGVETTLAAATKVTHRSTLLQPMWACACANNIRTFPVLPGIEHLTIVVDNDAKRAGQNAARACATRWADEGREVELLIPDMPGADFNDIVMMEGAS